MVASIEEIQRRVSLSKNIFRKKLYPDFYPEWYVEKLKKLSTKYRPIRWLPLDIPKFEFENYNDFIEIFDRESIPIVRTNPCAAEPWSKDQHPLRENSHWYNPQFKGCYIYKSNPKEFEEGNLGIWTYKYYPHTVFDPIVDHVKKYFPFYFIDSMVIWESVKEVIMHSDQNLFLDCPTEFRIMLHDGNPRPTLFVADMEHHDQNYIDLPSDTNNFCWSNGSQLHGSDYLGLRKQLLIINGHFSISKLEELVDRSILKYRDQLNYKLEM